MQNPNETAQEIPVEEVVEAEIVPEIANDTAGELAEAKDKYLRLYAEFENFRRRTAKEKTDLIKNGGEDIIKALIPILDDFERAQKSFEKANESNSVSEEEKKLKEGVILIHQKLVRTLEQKGLKTMESTVGKEFDVNEQESITNIPAPTEEMRGKVIDELERGYYLNEKILRFAKVVVGS